MWKVSEHVDLSANGERVSHVWILTNVSQDSVGMVPVVLNARIVPMAKSAGPLLWVHGAYRGGTVISVAFAHQIKNVPADCALVGAVRALVRTACVQSSHTAPIVWALDCALAAANPLLGPVRPQSGV